ncbi:hypothetical protein APHAL10511_004706 [Amanita phalloides]|nr:hypothetical protein APHAL10511_004706 [Amanita phalloides]
MTWLLQLSVIAVSLAASSLATPLSTSPLLAPSRDSSIGIAPLVAPEHVYGTISNSYIVVFKDGVSSDLRDNHLNFLMSVNQAEPLLGGGSGITHVYNGPLMGYAGKFSDRAIDEIRAKPEVDFVERDQVVRTQNTTLQTGATWGLARISHRPRLAFSTFNKYLYDSIDGEGVDVYVIDTGINTKHVEFEGRAKWGVTVPQDDEDDDGNGHGTHTAGTIASRKYGVAKKAEVYAVKVLGSNGSGSMSDVAKGVEFAANAAKVKATSGNSKHRGSVANMSLGGSKSVVLDKLVDRAVASGLHFAVAAGNDNRDACNFSPAGAQKAITVGASTLGDERAYFSNWGRCVDVFGLNIRSTYKGSDHATAVLSGTSMAAPHTAGLMAYLLSIYPSPQFNPTFDEQSNLLSLQSQQTFDAYTVIHASLPTWISDYMPSPRLLEALTAPVPEKPKTLTPLQLKNAIVALASPGLLTGLPADTVNLLIFNNATA